MVVLDTIVYDASDPEDARGVAVRHLCACGLVAAVVYLTMDAQRLVEGLLTRTMRRAKGVEAQHPAADETPAGVARLLKKNAAYSETTVPKMEAFVAEAKALGIPVMRHPAVPLPDPWDSVGVSHDRSWWSFEILVTLMHATGIAAASPPAPAPAPDPDHGYMQFVP
jgi:hypothetical protein